MNAPAFAGESPALQVHHLPLGQITPDADQIRREFEPEALQQLAESIREHGVIQPIVVRPTPKGSDGTLHVCPYEIVAGERRWRAASIAGLASIPAIVRTDLDEERARVLQVLENLQRADLSLDEEARGVAIVAAVMGCEKTAQQLGKSPAWVSKRSKLATLHGRVQELVADKVIQSIDVALELDELYQYDKRCGDDRAHEFEWAHRNGGHPPTRSRLRNYVASAKDRHQRKEAEKAERRDLRERAKSGDEQAADQLFADREAEKRLKGIKERRDTARKTYNELADRLTGELCQLAGLPIPERQSWGYRNHEPLTVRPPYLSDWDRAEPPAADAAEYTVECNGNLAQISAAAGAMDMVDGIRAHIEKPITLDQAKAIAAILGEQVCFSATLHQRSGRDLIAHIRRKQGLAEDGTPANDPNGSALVQAFIGERIQHAPGVRLKASEAYAAYTQWCTDTANTPMPAQSNQYGAAWASLGIEKKRLGTGVHYLDVQLKQPVQ